MSTLTFTVTLPSRVGTNLSIDIIGTNLHVDWGNGETTTQEPNTERIFEKRWFDISWTATNSDFKSWTVTITGDIIGVGTNCFNLGGRYVTEITLPEGLETIEHYGLQKINAEKVIIPSTVTNIGSYFLYQSGVKEVVFLTENLTELKRWFLFEATQVEFVKLPEGLISFDTNYTTQKNFYNCTSLKTLEVPSTLEAFPISNTNANNFVNVQLETLKMNGGPISNPPITENTKIVVPLSKLQDFINHSDYPDERERYDIFGKNLSEKIYVLGTHLAENLQDKNITANANEGLTTLANKIHDINAPNYKELTYNLVWNDNDNEYGFRPSQFSTLLLANNEVVGGCLFPQDDDINTLYHANNIQSEYSYTTQVPESDLNGKEITYTWKPLKPAREYGVPQVNTSQDVSSTIMTPVQIMLTVQGDTFDSDTLGDNQLIFSSEESAPIIDWGDDTTEVYNKNESLHHTFSDGRDKHIITIDGNITALGGSCFLHNTSITNITFLDDNIKLDNNNLFYDCLSLTSIALPNNLTSIGDTCFQFCSSLQSINLPTSIVSLGFGCFSYCLSLANIVLPNTLTSIPDYCFRKCSSLTSVTLPSGLTDIGRYCFYDCLSLSNISLPNTLTSIPEFCFENCSSLTNIILPDNITSIGQSSFSSSGLTSITIPSSVTYIGWGCFMYCYSLRDVTFQSSTPPSFEQNIFRNTSITIHVPQGAKSAYETALKGQNGAHNWTIVEES